MKQNKIIIIKIRVKSSILLGISCTGEEGGVGHIVTPFLTAGQGPTASALCIGTA